MNKGIAVVLLSSVLAAPLWAGKPDPKPDLPQVGESREIRLVPDSARFVRETSERGATVHAWRDTIKIPGAAFLKARFANFNLAPGDVLIVRSKTGEVVEQLEGLGPKKAGSFWGLSVFGDEIRFELRARSRYTGAAPFAIEQVIVGDARVLAEVAGRPNGTESICAPEDYDDVICYNGDAAKWANVMASVGVMTTGGGVALWCSGSNVSPNNYLLTNYHCIPQAGTCASSEFVFKYYRTACNTGAGPTGDWVGYRCDETVASSPIGDCDPTLAALDYSLSSVVGDPASTFGYVTPDPTPLTSGERIYIVQHPDGRPHEIAHGEGADVVVDTAGSSRTLRYYDTLDTEGGSSGSPIFRDSDDKMVGLHHCGGCESPGVGNRGMLMSDIYPAISQYVCSTALSIATAASQAPVEISGNGDNFLDPGETWSVVPVLRNGSCDADALAVSATVAVAAGSSAVTLLDTAATFGTIEAGQSAAAQQPIRFTVGGACAGEVILEITSVSSSSGSHPGGEIFRQPIGSVPTTSLVFENFAGGIPGTWTLVNGGTGSGAASTWTTANPGGRTLLVPPFAIADSDRLGTGQTMDEELITPAVSTTGFTNVSLELEHVFRYYTSGQAEKGDIDVRSTATGGNWVNVRRFDSGDVSGHLSVDLTPYSAANLQVRFHYYNAVYEWYWAIDDVAIRGDHGQICAGGAFFSDGFESGNTSGWSFSQP